MKQNRFFPYLVGLSAFLVAASAAFFSVFGLSKLFSGASLQVIIMAGSLEFSKIVAASFLYRFWQRINKLMKIYFIVGVVVLVIITSAGIFGYLSNAYQGATLEFEQQSQKVMFYEEELDRLKTDKEYLLGEMEEQIASFPDNYLTAKRQTRERYLNQVNEINLQIQELSLELSELKVSMVKTGIDVGPVIYIAQSFNVSVDVVVKFFILILIFVFDPMAVALVIATNITLSSQLESVEKNKDKIDKIYEKYKEHKEPVVEEVRPQLKSTVSVLKKELSPDKKEPVKPSKKPAATTKDSIIP